MKNGNLELAADIKNFLEKHAGKNEDDEFTSPDAYELQAVQGCLEAGESVRYPNASWESGGFRPYTSNEARTTFNDLIARIKNHISKQSEG